MVEHHHEALRKTLSQDQKVLFIALLITSLMMVAEFIGGVLSNSLALVSDAGHMLTDTSALLLSFLVVVFISGQPATSKKTYGFYRLEILAALFNGSILILLAFYLFYRAYNRFIHPEEVKSGLMLFVAMVGFLANLSAGFFLFKSSQRGLNVRGAFLHVVSDALTSLGVIFAGMVILFTQWYPIDPLVSIIIGLFIMYGAVRLIGESTDILMEATPREINLEKVIKAVKKVSGVMDFHDVHIWTITSGFYALSGHLLIDDRLVSKANELLLKVNQLLLEKFRIQHATIQLECETGDDRLVCRLK